jgi:DNA-binding NtrC family response regulator
MSDKVLITMDDLETAVRVNAVLEAAGNETVMVSSLDDACGELRRSNPDVVVLSGALHERPAQELISLSRDRSISSLGLLEATEPDPAGVAQGIGLTGWLAKPVAATEVASAAQRLAERRRLQKRTGIVGESPAIQELLVKIEQIAPVSSTVLIEGESGTGKELAAHAIHELSPRRDKPFIAVNCSALPETLLESELFGHEKGAFTGAAERRHGRFELANQGTLLLDEVGEMPLSTQVKLLRVLEDRTFFRVGGTEPIRVDVRIVAASNRQLKQAVALGEFREDLYFRLNVLSIYLPPLRERKGDIPILVTRLIGQLSQEHNRSFRGIAGDAMHLLVNAHWPGNVRQLKNLLESMVVLAPGQEIGASDIPADVREEGTRLLPMRVPERSQHVQGKELEFIFRSLVDLKLQIEDLRRRVEHEPEHVEVIEVGERSTYGEGATTVAIDLTERAREEVGGRAVLYEPGMTMAEVERAAIESALKDSGGNRRKTAEKLGIGERTLYRKIKEFGLG